MQEYVCYKIPRNKRFFLPHTSIYVPCNNNWWKTFKKEKYYIISLLWCKKIAQSLRNSTKVIPATDNIISCTQKIIYDSFIFAFFWILICILIIYIGVFVKSFSKTIPRKLYPLTIINILLFFQNSYILIFILFERQVAIYTRFT